MDKNKKNKLKKKCYICNYEKQQKNKIRDGIFEGPNICMAQLRYRL